MYRKASILGLGRMGLSIAKNLCDRGLFVYAYNRTKKKFDEKYNIATSFQPQETIGNSNIILITLSDSKAISDVLLYKNDLKWTFLPNSTVIDLTTHDPDYAKYLSHIFLKNRIHYIDAPVSGGPEKALKGSLTLMLGCKYSTYKRTKAFLRLLGKNIFYMGENGAGQAAKLVNQIMVGISQLATCEAICFADLFNMNMDLLLEVITCSAGDSFIFRRSATQMKDCAFTNGFQTYLIHKDLLHILKAAKDGHLNLPVSRIVARLLKKHKNSGYGNMDAASIYLHYIKYANT